jgi:di/tricarboxylate transporter|tara:strand:+ start:2243 stop:4057 length:1815 start_codon:yes stop_codon:yes gene_type:complete
MTWEIIFVLFTLIATVGSFVWERVPTDVTALTAFGVILLAGSLPISDNLPKTAELFNVFSSTAPLTIAAMFIISAALEKTGGIEIIANSMVKLSKLGTGVVVLAMVFVVGGLSAFINNTPVVVIFLPVILHLAREMDVPASKLLIPLSYASIFGGACTLVGTSTNILASDILRLNGQEPLTMFELTKLGFPLLILGAIYLAFVSTKIIPRRQSLTAILSEEERREYITEAYIRSGSQLIGKTIAESGLKKQRGVRILELVRHEVAVKDDIRTIIFQAGDRLILSCRPSGFVEASSVEGLHLLGEETGLQTIAAHEGSIVEGVIGPRSSVVGKTIKELNFRQRFRMILIAIHRRGINMRDKIDTLPLEFGDTILMMGTDEAKEQIRRGGDILLLDHAHTPAQNMRSKQPIVLGVLAGIIGSVSFGFLPISAAAILGVVVLFVTNTLKPKEAYAAVDWSLLILIYSMLGLGMAMDRSGASGLVTEGLVGLTNVGISPEWQPYVLLIALYAVTNALTELLSNNATVVLMTPIAIALGTTLGVDPRPFVIATCMASSASFSTPIGYQTNTYVYGVGGYRFKDFLKVGIPLNLIYMAGAVILIPMLWSF